MMITSTQGGTNWEKHIFLLAHVLPNNIGAGFMIYFTIQQGAMVMFWLHFWGAVLLPISVEKH